MKKPVECMKIQKCKCSQSVEQAIQTFIESLFV